MRSSLVCALVILVGCGKVGETPISIDLSVEVPGTGEIPEGAPTSEEPVQMLIASDGVDLEAARQSIPKIARGITAIEAVEVSLDSPDLGPVGTWIAQLHMYASADGELSDDDVDMGDYALEVDDEALIIPVSDEVNDMLVGDELTILIDATLRTAPEDDITLPLTLDAIGYIKIF